MAQHIRKGDLVRIISGDDAHKANPVGRVLRVLPKRRLVVVEGMNLCRKHVRPGYKKSPQGGIIEKEMPMSISCVMPVVEGKATRVRFQTRPDGSKVRVAARGGAVIGNELKKAGR